MNFRIIEPDGADKPAIPVGTVVTVHAKGYSVVSRNDVGGTLQVPEGLYKVRIVRQWWDYETGQHYAAMVTRKGDVNRIAKAGKTPYTPKSAEYDPSAVFFCDDAIVPQEILKAEREFVKKRGLHT